jgi:hypothetical protein
MKTATRSEYLTRGRILELLSDEEVASVANAESAERLADGDEYLDLDQLGIGVQIAGAAAAPMGHVLPKKAIHEGTWSKLLNELQRAPGWAATELS